MPRPAPRTARSLSATALAAAPLLCLGFFLLLVVGSGGCEVAVGDTVPAFACEQGSGDTCPPNQMCDSTNRCVPCPASGCGSTMTVDSGTGAEVSVNDTGAPLDTSMPDTATMLDTSTPVDTGTVEAGCGGGVGCACSGSASCTSHVCGDQESVTSGLYSAAGNANFCTQPCCTSSDCPTGTVCFPTAAGGNYCVLPQWVGLTQGIGGGTGGASCGTGRDCRSGLCQSSHCVDTCCSEQTGGQCSGSSVCTFSAFPGMGIDTHYTANCGTSGGSGTNGHSCSVNGDCESQICAADTMFGNQYCHAPCRSAADCATGSCGGGPCACEYVLANGNADLVAACFSSSGNTAEGDSCSTTNDTCATGFCDPNSMKCTSVCFTNADCTTSGWTCRPEQVTVSGGGSYSVLACGT